MAKSIKRNYIYNLSYQILILLTPLITAPYIARVLGADGVGIVSYAESIVAYFTLFGALGISTYGQREISYVQDDAERRSQVFWNTKTLEWITSGAALIVYALFLSWKGMGGVYWVMALNIVSDLLDVTWLYQGLEEFGQIVLRNTIIRVVNIIWIFTMVRKPGDVVFYAISLAAGTVLTNLSLWFSLPKYVHRIPLKQIHPFTGFKTVIALFIPSIAISVYVVLDKTMLGAITGNAFESGYYQQASAISKMVMSVVTSLGTVMVPRIGFYFQKGETNKVKDLMYQGYQTIWMLGIPLCFGLIIVSRNFIPWFLGPGYEEVPRLLAILAFLILAIGINGMTGAQYLIPTKKENLYTASVISGAVINFTLNSILIPRYAAAGAAAASLAAECGVAIIQLIMVRKELSSAKIFKLSTHYLIAGIAMAIVLLLEDHAFSVGVLQTLAMVLSGMVIYFMVLILEKDDYFLANARTVLMKFHIPVK